MIDDTWKNFVIKKLFIFKEMLNILKARFKVWNIEVFGKLDLEVNVIVKELNSWDNLVALDDRASRGISPKLSLAENELSRIHAKTEIQMSMD